jgi:hypothetical protein
MPGISARFIVQQQPTGSFVYQGWSDTVSR